MKKLLITGLFSIGLFGSYSIMQGQSKLYPHLFDLQEVHLNDGIFRKAMLLNNDVLLQYDVDRLLTPYFRQAGITEWEALHPNFPNWGSGSFRLDGHVGGHYLTALALAYASATEVETRQKFLDRLNYVVDKMDECQSRFDQNTDGLYGYIGGLPDNAVWTDLYKGNFGRFNSNWGNVPLYTMHKVYAGLRDAYIYAGNEKARKCFLKLCDWGINLISKVPDTDVQNMLNCEHGGINEVYVDAYQLTGEAKYLEAAKRYSHQHMVDGMQTLNTTFLNSKHANTQVPKYIGFARLATIDRIPAEQTDMQRYRKAALNFWKDVTQNRTVALGGNSVSEHFLPADRCSEYINHPDGPESCNTNNMMKLTEDLFAENKSVAYVDFYEQAMLNHILSTQNPTTGGYVYFTSLRPQHYRMYSQVNQGMWCCVGTGMENHSKYGEFIYARNEQQDTLYINLFVSSTLDNERFGIKQETSFPYEEKTRLTITRNGEYNLAIRRPNWCSGDFTITVNGTQQTLSAAPGTYATLHRQWTTGDIIEVNLPMHLQLVPCPNYKNYIAFTYGPVLLGAKTGTENLAGQFAGEGRMDHAPSQGSQLSLTSAPILIGERTSVLEKVKVLNKTKLQFQIDESLYNSKRFADLVLEPFFTIHESRYMIYWNQLTQNEWDRIKDDVIAEENAIQHLNERTLDKVATGEQQSDAGHVRLGDFETGNYSGEYYIDALSGKWFSYQLDTKGIKNGVSLFCRYHSADRGRIYTIYIDNKEFRTIRLEEKGFNGFYNVEYPISPSFLIDELGNTKPSITVKFVASGSTPTPGIYYLRLLKGYEPLAVYRFHPTQWISCDANRVIKVEPIDNNQLKVHGYVGNNNIALMMDKQYDDQSYILKEQKYFLVKGTPLSIKAGASYLWWLNGQNKNSQVPPTYKYQSATDQQTYILWDVSKSGLDGYMQADNILISSNTKGMTTVFGVTSESADGVATISDIGFYSAQQAVDKYHELAGILGLQPTGIQEAGSDIQPMNDHHIYTLGGMKYADKQLNTLPQGVYIQNRTKVINNKTSRSN